MPDESEPTANNKNHADRLLLLYLRFIGWVTVLAFAAAMMPESWMVATAKVLTIDPFPDSPLTFYLARNLSLVYGFLGVGLLIITNDLDRYRPFVRKLAIGTMVFGVLQIVCDTMSAIPWWWSVGEGTSAIFGGALIYWLDWKAKQSINDQ